MSSLSPAEQLAAENAAEVIYLRAQLRVASTTPVTKAVIKPLRGGIINGIAWTGGGLTGSPFERTAPKSVVSYRPEDFRGMSTVNAKCTAEFPAASCLDSISTCQVSILSYLSDIKTFLTLTGQDGVFLAEDTAGKERNILDHSGMYTAEEIAAHVKDLRASGDSYDENNLVTSGVFMLKTIGPTLKREIGKFLHDEDLKTGPYIFMLIYERIVTCSASTWRTLETDLAGLNLSTEPGENVETFAEKLSGICRTLEGAGMLPKDAAMLVTRSLMTSKVPVFAQTFLGIYGELNKKPKSHKWDDVIMEGTSLYRNLVQSKMWTVDTPRGSPAGLASELVATDGSSTMTCHNCGVVGHMARNCPKNTKDPWKSTPPSAGAQQTMTRSEKKYYWCGTCKHWNLTHLTGDHKAGSGDRRGGRRGTDTAPKTPDVVAPAPSAAVAITPTPQPVVTPDPTPSGLVMQQGFMCGFVGGITTEADPGGYESSGTTWTYGVDEHGELVREQGCHNKKPSKSAEDDSYHGLWSSSDDDSEHKEKPAKVARFLVGPPGQDHGLLDDSSDSDDDFDDAVEFISDVEKLDQTIALKD